MALYFTAPSDAEAAAARDHRPTGDETARSMLSPDGGALDSLNALLTDAPDQDANNPRSVVSRVSDGVYRLDDAFVAALADRDQDEVTDLVAPWQEQVLDPGDLEDFLINLQHVARHARANGHQVYGLDD